jgi:hypothetical protein
VAVAADEAVLAVDANPRAVLDGELVVAVVADDDVVGAGGSVTRASCR